MTPGCPGGGQAGRVVGRSGRWCILSGVSSGVPIRLAPRGRPLPSRRDLGRSDDRRITQAGLAVAGVFLALAVAAVWLPADARLGVWLPLHLAFAGAAAQAIGAVMPFFSAALSSAPPAPPRWRVVALVLLGGGAALVATRVVPGAAPLPAAGGALSIAGVGVLAVVTFQPVRRALGRRHPVVLAAYGLGLADLAVGAGVATLQVGGYLPVLQDWAAWKPAHAWLNLLGFVALVVTGTLVHLYPTVTGTLIRDRPAVVVAVGGIGLGAPLVAAGYALHADAAARLGALAAVGGAAGLVHLAVATWRDRGTWTTDLPWHRLTTGHLSAGIAWFAVAILIAAQRTLAAGADPAGWSIAWLVAPLAVGWMTQTLIGAWSHLLPAIGPGDPERHAWQRRLLGRGAIAQLAAINAGAALLAAGVPAGSVPVAVAGAIVAAGGVALGLGKLAAAGLPRREAG